VGSFEDIGPFYIFRKYQFHLIIKEIFFMMDIYLYFRNIKRYLFFIL